MRAQRGWRIGALAVIALLVAPQAWAQRQNNPAQNQPGQQAPQAQPAQVRQQRTTLRAQQGESLADHEIASWLILANEAEVQLSTWAQDKAQGKQVKDFAEQMTKDHPALIQRLRPFAPDAPTLPSNQNSENRQGNQRQGQVAKGEQAPQTQTSQAENGQRDFAAQNQNQGLPFVRVCTQIAERNLAGLQKELGEKKGSEFDHAYMGTQMMSHLAIYNTMEVLRPYASQELQNVIDEGIQTTRSHWQMAKQACESLDREHRTSDDSNRRDPQ